MKTKVVFRKFKDGDDIIALFPCEDGDRHGNVMSYQHIGQHGVACYAGVIQKTTPATPAEYIALKRELRQIGYEMQVITRRPAR